MAKKKIEKSSEKKCDSVAEYVARKIKEAKEAKTKKPDTDCGCG